MIEHDTGTMIEHEMDTGTMIVKNTEPDEKNNEFDEYNSGTMIVYDNPDDKKSSTGET